MRFVGFVFPFIFVSPAPADVSGFEHLTHVSIDCGKIAIEPAKAREIKGHSLCTYENKLCKVMNNKEFQFEAYITVDCETKDAKRVCPDIHACAKPNQLSESVADEVRKNNDPNFNSDGDGANMKGQ